MKRNKTFIRSLLVFYYICIAFFFLNFNCTLSIIPSDFEIINNPPEIFPPSHGTIIPPNICPMNFIVKEEGDFFVVDIYGKSGNSIKIKGKNPCVFIPESKWKNLLKKEKTKIIYIDIYVNKNKRWYKYETLYDTIAKEPIDSYIVYRKIPVCKDWTVMGIYQRNVEKFSEKAIFHNKETYSCFNCHSFLNNSPDNMILQFRSKTYGTPMFLKKTIGEEKMVIKAINTKTPFTSGKAGFTAWHPEGRFIAFTINKFEMLFHTSGYEPRFVYNGDGDIAIYDVKEKNIFTGSELSQKEQIENMPAWSPDGKYLYFCKGPKLPENNYKNSKFDLLRIEFNAYNKSWGKIDTILTAIQVNGSITQPRISPDGRFILVNVCEFGDFPIDKYGTRLGLFDIKTNTFKIFRSKSNFSDTWHSFSKNGRWIAFNSKRLNGRFSSVFICYLDANGNEHSAFVLPQKDPKFYEYSLSSYNIPEFVTSKVRISSRQIASSLKKYRKTSRIDVTTTASPQKDERKDEF